MTSKLITTCFTWGIHKPLKINNYKPKQLSASIDSVKAISIGKYHCGLVTTCGELYTYGNNKYKHLTHQTTTVPQKVNVLPAAQVQCGDDFTLALTNNGNVYSWGSSGSKSWWAKIFGSRHCLGVNTKEDILIPQYIEIDEEILEIACGSNHCLALGKFNLYCWGFNDYGQVGPEKLLGCVPIPKPLKFFTEIQEQVTKIFAGENTSAALTDKGRLYVWGSNKNFQLGLNLNTDFEPVPVLVPLSDIYSVKDLYIGQNSIILITHTHDIYVAGLKYWKKFQKFLIPAEMEPLQVLCGEDYFAVLCKDNRIAYYGGIFSLDPGFDELPDKVYVSEYDYIPGNIKRIEGKYAYLAAITEIEV
jgi:alpha-tubulin suppressor-like RCC1 family protein